MKPYDLGRKAPEISAPLDSKSSTESEEKHYPSVYLSDIDGLDLPESGKMTVRFKRNSKMERTDKEGTCCDYSIDILSIESVTPDEGGKDDRISAADALDALRAKLEEDAEDGGADDETE